MQVTADTPTSVRSIGGLSIKMPQPYAPGHVITEGEASQLNQVFAENVLNNQRKHIEAGVVEGEGEAATRVRDYTAEEAQAKLDAYIATYEMGVRRASEAVVVDPIEREARKLAKEQAEQLIREMGGKPKDYDIPSVANSIFEANSEVLLNEAKKLVKARDAAKAKAAEGGMDLSSFLKPKVAEADAPAAE